MHENEDVERGEDYKVEDNELQSLLPSASPSCPNPAHANPTPRWWRFSPTERRFSLVHLASAFMTGLLAGLLVQFLLCDSIASSPRPDDATGLRAKFANPNAGSTERHNFPPPSPTNVYPSLFPTNVGYAGGTPTGAEPALVATAPSYPIHTGAAELVVDKSVHQSTKFELLKSWGNLSPWYSVKRGTFGLDSSPEPPDTCRITGLHLLHRHGARYPTEYASYGGPSAFARRIHAASPGFTATGDLEFLNDWTYKLGEEVLTPFGRQQLFDLGVSMRLKYGFLLKNFTESNTLPVFRTESQDRMLASAQNFALGFFGYPFEDKYLQSITIEAGGFNNTLSPYETCPNAKDNTKANRGIVYTKKWAETYLKDAQARLAPQIKGYDLTIEDMFTLQQMCAYETVALGFSKFCTLFTEDEWTGFNYALDLLFWYNSAYGCPISRALGVGYVQELVARLTHTPIPSHNSSTNSTLDDNPITFPLNQSLYVDATHEVVVFHVLTALNLTNFAKTGPLPADHIPAQRSFVASQLAPFATNVQFQLLECTSTPGQQIRVIVNDGVSPLTGIKGCPEQKDGMCPVDTFVAAQKELISQTDWVYACHGDWTIPDGWETVSGDPPEAV